MKRALRSVGAVAMGVLLVTSMALGGVMMTNPNVDNINGAADHVVQTSEGQVALGGALLVGAASVMIYDEYIKNDPNTEDLQQADAVETKKEIYDQASIQIQNNDLTNTAYENYLNDTESIALMEGKNAYIRALENGSAEAQARNAAIEAVADYYAVKQQNLIAGWNTTVTVAESARATANNTTGVSKGYVGLDITKEDSRWTLRFMNDEFQTTTVQLVNGTTATAYGAHVEEYASSDGNKHGPWVLAPDSRHSTSSTTFHGFVVGAPTDNYDPLLLGDHARMVEKWNEVQTQNDDVQAQLDDFINATYSEYQQGTINSSDLVDPYLGAREYTPETSDSWALRTLSAMGINSPENLSNIGRMEIVSGSVTYSGILMSDGTPAEGYVVGGTYNTTNITGAQFVALDDGDVHELEGDFTLKSAETTEGETIAENETVTYNNVTYQTADTQEFQELQQQLDNLTAQINARQQRLRNSGGGGGFLPDFGFGGIGSIGIPIGLLAAGAAVFVIANRP